MNDKIISEYVLPTGKVLVLKATRSGGRSDHSPDFVYPGVGETVTAPAWDGKAECGPGGLHGWLWGCGSVQNAGAEWAFSDPAAEWRVLEVDGSECLDIDSGSKCKFRTGSVILLATLQECAMLLARHAPAGSAIIGGTATAGNDGTATAGVGGTATAGDRGTATAGNDGTATAGDRGTATAGDRGTATAGVNGTATAGVGGTATAGDRGTATAGYCGTATAGVDGIVMIKRWDTKLGRYRWVIGEVGIDGVEANVPYVLDDHGKLVRK